MVFSDSITKMGIVEQVRAYARVDAQQWPTVNIANSVNDWLDAIAGYAIASDQRFQWDDTNHTTLPEGTTNLVANQTDYSFLTDQLGNTILNLLGISVLINGQYVPLEAVDRNSSDVDLATFGTVSGTPTQYDKIADNIIRLDKKPSATVTNGLKFYFQRTPSYFYATDTSKSTGIAPTLDRGFVIAATYDAALTLGLPSLQSFYNERERELAKVREYFKTRNTDISPRLSIFKQNNR